METLQSTFLHSRNRNQNTVFTFYNMIKAWHPFSKEWWYLHMNKHFLVRRFTTLNQIIYYICRTVYYTLTCKDEFTWISKKRYDITIDAAGVTRDLGLVSFIVPVQKPVTTSKEYRTFSNTNSHGTPIRIRIVPKY